MKKNKTLKILVSGYIGFNNFGDEAIFKALRLHLKKYGCVVSALSASSTYDVQTYDYKSPLAILKAILACDVLISGGGSLLQNKTSNKSLLYYLGIIFLAKLFSKKVIIFAQGIEPVEGETYQDLLKYILKQCDFISVRDKKSYDLLRSWSIKSTLVSDPIYSLLETIEPEKEKKGLVVQLRKIKDMNNNFASDLAKVVAKYYKKVKVVSFQKEYDDEICKEFMQKFKELGGNAEYLYNASPERIIDTINSAQYVISMRLHGLMVSNALKNQTFAVSYDEKIQTIIKEMNLQNINIYSYSFEELDKKLQEFFTKTHSIYQYRPFVWNDIDRALIQRRN